MLVKNSCSPNVKNLDEQELSDVSWNLLFTQREKSRRTGAFPMLVKNSCSHNMKNLDEQELFRCLFEAPVHLT